MTTITIGQKFGSLEVRSLSRVREVEKITVRYWLVRCACGRQEEMRTSRLLFDEVTVCSRCRVAQRKRDRRAS